MEWLPYRNMDSMVIPEDIKSTLILGRSKTMLICFDKAERHLPNRCLRQYGMLQSVPEDVQRWERKSRGVDGGVDLSGKMELELNEWLDRRLHIVEGDDGADESEYMQWNGHTHAHTKRVHFGRTSQSYGSCSSRLSYTTIRTY